MQPMVRLRKWLERQCDSNHYIFKINNLRALFPDLANNSFKALLSRAVKSDYLLRPCRSIYLFKPALPNEGLVLFHIAATLRAEAFNYISLETVLSDVGVISPNSNSNYYAYVLWKKQISYFVNRFGKIEFIHTQQRPEQLSAYLEYDSKCHLWRANVNLALRDMKSTHRNMDLIDWNSVNDFV